MLGDRGTPKLLEHFSSTQNQLPVGETITSLPQRSQRSGTFFCISVFTVVSLVPSPRSAHPAHYDGIKAIKRTENVAKAHCSRSFLSFLICPNERPGTRLTAVSGLLLKCLDRLGLTNGGQKIAFRDQMSLDGTKPMSRNGIMRGGR